MWQLLRRRLHLTPSCLRIRLKGKEAMPQPTCRCLRARMMPMFSMMLSLTPIRQTTTSCE